LTTPTLLNALGLEISIVDNVVYLWHYDVKTIVYGGDGFLTIEDITSDPNEILDTINCVSYSQICSLIKSGLSLCGGSC